VTNKIVARTTDKGKSKASNQSTKNGGGTRIFDRRYSQDVGYPERIKEHAMMTTKKQALWSGEGKYLRAGSKGGGLIP